MQLVESLRIDAGRPRFGVDMTDDTIPLEAGLLERAISTTKGCYVGQEIIIRILHRGGGRVAKRLVAATHRRRTSCRRLGARVSMGAGARPWASLTSVARRAVVLAHHRDSATSSAIVAEVGQRLNLGAVDRGGSARS